MPRCTYSGFMLIYSHEVVLISFNPLGYPGIRGGYLMGPEPQTPSSSGQIQPIIFHPFSPLDRQDP